MATVREIIWPEEFIDLKRIEQLMVCGICYEYMETSVVTRCSHNYCSLCIRKYLHFKPQCPACFYEVHEKDLIINRSLDILIQHYLQVREKLIRLIENRNVYNAVMTEDEPVSNPPVKPTTSSPLPQSPKVTEKKNNVSKPTDGSPVPSTSKQSFFTQTPTKLSKNKLPSIAKIFSTPKRKDISSQSTISSSDFKAVMCPVCSVDIPENHINVHLDACLKRETQEKTIKQKPVKPKRNPLPKLVFRVMKDAEIRKKMKEFGLPTHGDRKALESRFTKYSVIYNSECDKPEPRPVADLIRQCEMEEKQERKISSFLVSSAGVNRLQVDRNAKEEKIEEAQKNYREANKSSFDKLIEEVKKRRLEEKTKRQNEERPISSKSSFQSTSETISSITKSEGTVDMNPTTEFVYSDSEESCLLQHYQNDGPTKFCTENLNDSISTSNSPVKSQNQEKEFSNNCSKNLNSINDSDSSVKSPNQEKETTNNFSKNLIDSVTRSKSPLKSQNQEKNISETYKKEKSSEISKYSEEQYEVSTDEEISSSPTSKKSGSPGRKIREAAAKDLCNSIIHDFSFDELSDESLSEFKIKKQETKEEPKEIEKEETKEIEKEKQEEINKSGEEKEDIDTDEDEIANSLIEINKFNRSKLQKNSLEELSNDAGENKSEDDAFPLEILNGDSFDEFVNNSTVASQILNHSIRNGIEVVSGLSNGIPEKENCDLSFNEQLDAIENLGRPVRKRNRPTRFGASNQEEGQSSTEPNDSEKATCLEKNPSQKRRRGRVKSNVNSPDENPPKRPNRRRQTPVNM